MAWRARRRGTIPNHRVYPRRPRERPDGGVLTRGASLVGQWLRLVLDQLPRLDDLRPRVSATDLGQPRPLGAGGHGGCPGLAGARGDCPPRSDLPQRLVLWRVPDAP